MSKMTIEYGYKVWRNKAAKIHRVDGPAVIYADGSQEWFSNGERHRVDGPAYIHSDGYQAWYNDGKLHRLDGPAIIHPNGSQEWFIDDVNKTNEAITWMKDMYIGLDYTKWTDTEKMWFKLRLDG